jgi:hypothetical protein
MLKAEDARNALIELVGKTDDMVLQLSLPSLMAKEAVQVDTNEIAIGRWHCDLARQTFIASVGSGGHFAEYQGVFEQSSDGKWHAKITGAKRT